MREVVKTLPDRVPMARMETPTLRSFLVAMVPPAPAMEGLAPSFIVYVAPFEALMVMAGPFTLVMVALSVT